MWQKTDETVVNFSALSLDFHPMFSWRNNDLQWCVPNEHSINIDQRFVRDRPHGKFAASFPAFPSRVFRFDSAENSFRRQLEISILTRQLPRCLLWGMQWGVGARSRLQGNAP